MRRMLGWQGADADTPPRYPPCMARVQAVYRCAECGGESPRWLGRCPGCGAWGSLADTPARAGTAAPGAPIPMLDVEASDAAPLRTGVGELDRVLGGGLVPGSVTLLGGEPGIGKSTLVLQAVAGLARAGHRSLVLCAEEAPRQVRARAHRVGSEAEGIDLLAEVSLPVLLSHLRARSPDVLVVDSIQTVCDPDLPGAPGSVSQVRECAHRLVREARERAMATLLVGHVTKDGDLAGPRVLEHVVDPVLSFEGDRHHALRMLRVLKHRFGSTQELGLFEMVSSGLRDVPDASALFLADRRPGQPGSVVAPLVDGARPMLVEVQALVAEAHGGVPRRSVQGLDAGRLALLLAVLDRRVGVRLGGHDVYVSVAGGARIGEPAADLAVALSLAGAASDAVAPADTVAVGEVGLGGEIRQVPQTPRRLAEAARLGFRRALVPLRVPDVPGIELVRATTLGEALAAAGVA